MRYIVLVLLILSLIGTVSATTFGPSEPGWYRVEDVTDLMMSGYLINESELAVSQVYLLEIYSDDVSNILIVSNTYSANITITEPDWSHTTLNIIFTNATGDETNVTKTMNHIVKSKVPIYVLIGTPPLEWGMHQSGVSAKTYIDINLGDIAAIAGPIGMVASPDIPASFAFGWDVYYDGFIEPPQTFTVTSDGPIDVLFEVTTMEEPIDRRDRGAGEFALKAIRSVPWVGALAANSLELMAALFIFFIDVLIMFVSNWAIFFIVLETFFLLHGSTAIFEASGPLNAIMGFMTIFASDNLKLIQFVWYLIVEAFGLLFAIINTIRQAIPFI